MAKIWDVLFASAGDKQVIPVPVDPSGSVSVTQGWTPDYELPNTDPSYKPVGREEMNGAFNEVTDSIQQLQLQGAAEWSALLSPYPNGAEVIHSGQRWRSTAAGNAGEPGVGALWVNAVVPAASDTVAGIIRTATPAENAAGTLQGIAVDPLGIRESLNATGSAPIYACRAWVNFNGTGTVAIRASGNVSSITDNGTGDYTVNFTVAMPNENYVVTFGSYASITGNGTQHTTVRGSATAPLLKTSSSIRIEYSSTANGTLDDPHTINMSVIG